MTPRKVYNGCVPASEIRTAYQKAFRIGNGGWLQHLLGLILGIKIFQLADQYYQEADEELIQMILDADQGDKEEYETEWYDCDDFTFRLMGIFHSDRETAAMPIFITWVLTPEGGHAVLSYYKEGEIKIIEPQTDQVFPVPSNWSLLLVCG